MATKSFILKADSNLHFTGRLKPRGHAILMTGTTRGQSLGDHSGWEVRGKPETGTLCGGGPGSLCELSSIYLWMPSHTH